MTDRVVVRIGEYLEVRKLREDLSYWRRRQRKAYETEASAQLRRLCAHEISKIHDMITGYESKESCDEVVDEASAVGCDVGEPEWLCCSGLSRDGV